MTVKEILQEAYERGFVKGAYYHNTINDRHIAIHNPKIWAWDNYCKGLYCGEGHGLIYDDGKWGSVLHKNINIL